MEPEDLEQISPTEVFTSDNSNQVDFEIAFTAVVVTAVLSTPSAGQGYRLLKGLVVSLSLMTLVRKMAISNKHQSPRQILNWTMPFIQAITVVALVYLFLEASTLLLSILTLSLPAVAVASGIVPLFLLAVFGIHERVLGDASLYFALLCHNAAIRATDMDFFGYEKEISNWFFTKAGKFVEFSNSKAIPSELTWLKYRVDGDSSFPLRLVLPIGLIGYGLIWAIVSWVFGAAVLNVIFFIFVFFTKYPIQFWYSRFGLARFTSGRSGWIDASIILIGLVVANLTLLPKYG